MCTFTQLSYTYFSQRLGYYGHLLIIQCTGNFNKKIKLCNTEKRKYLGTNLWELHILCQIVAEKRQKRSMTAFQYSTKTTELLLYEYGNNFSDKICFTGFSQLIILGQPLLKACRAVF